MASYIKSDLEFILQQILISEQHAAGTPLQDLIAAPTLPFGVRTVDGTDNNLLPGQAGYGSADQEFPRMTDPVFRDAQAGTSYSQTSGLVIDSQPRIISNLIVDQTSSNPAAVAASGATGAPGETLFIPNVTPDAGLSAPYNSWFTLFGQFFDHGLDLVNKGGSGTIFIPLQPDDPLFVAGSPTNFMVLTRATNQPGADGILGTADDVHEHVNLTTPFVDQNQTYTSHPSHQVFLREYALDTNGQPVATGRMLDGAAGGLANWAEVKAQARNLLGLDLSDADVTNLPLLATDQYGRFIRGENGFAQIVTPTGLIEGNPAAPISTASALRTGHAFLDDIAHLAAPRSATGAMLTADTDTVAGADDGLAGTYDDELLNAHFITGDGRGNENIGLTAVHTVFHAEHNRLVDHTKEVILASGDPAFIAQWLQPGANQADGVQDLEWNGERLFQAARFGTEMQYQHLVFEEFARKVQPQVDIFIAPTGYDVTINPAIVAEFAHTVYRFGHSMLTEMVARINPDGTNNDIGLLQAFLNPLAFNDGGLSSSEAAGAIVRGMTRQVGNELDEFVTDVLRNNLLGLPLDLPTINITRARDTGIPSLNAARREFFDATGDSQLKPYTSWVDFAENAKHPESVINFIAAYGAHSSITGETTLQGKRDAATAIVLGTAGAPADRLDFLNGTGAWASGPNGVTITGVDAIDFWVGGLAEKQMPFGGLLGSTFNFVFETQMEALQNGDRFYYLARTAGMNFINELEQNSFASLIMANTDATHLPLDVFSTPTYILEVDQARQFNEGLGNADPTGGTIFSPLVVRGANSLKYTGEDHVVLGGTAGNDTLISGIGDDTLWGDEGKDRLEGGAGNDNIDGGAGDDIITDSGGDDVLKGGEGNDVIHGGNGLNLIIGGGGSDFIITGEDVSEVFAGTGNDFILGSTANEGMQGNEGDDWIEVGTQDGAPGDNFNPFGTDEVIGNDVFFGNGGFDEFVGEGGDDIMVGSPGQNRNEGMSGFDWVTYKDTRSVYADLLLPAFDETPIPPSFETALDRYENVEGLSGSAFNDVLLGSDVTALDMPTEGARGSVLTNIGLINGLQELVGAGVTSFDGGNIMLGGAGSDRIEGRGGDDIIDGDAWLNVRISVRDIANPNQEILTVNSMKQLQAAMLAGTYNPGQLQIVREILTAPAGTDIDTAVFSDILANYDITANPDGTLTIAHTGGTQVDGTDRVRNIEALQFADQIVVINRAPIGQPTISDTTPTESQQLSVSVAAIADADGTSTSVFSHQWQVGNGTTFSDIVGATLSTFTPGQAQVGSILRVLTTYTDDRGTFEQVTSAPTAVVGDLITGTAAGETLLGTLADDELRGLGGNDTLNGGAGADLMAGGLGNDTYIVDNALDVVTELAGEGTDTAQTTLSSYALGANVENLSFTGTGNFAGVGNALNNTIRGGGGNDSLTGNAGDDSLNGLAGEDAMAGGLGNDTYVVDNALDSVTEGAGEGTDVVQTTLLSYTLGDNLENLLYTGAGTSAGNFAGTGNALNNLLRGGSGNDILNGAAGNDTINGGLGVDTIIGGIGNDVMDGGLGNDRFVFAASGFGNDSIAGFDGNPVDGQDLLDISGLGIDAATFGASVNITDLGANTLVQIGADSILLLGIGDATTITANDFILAA